MASVVSGVLAECCCGATLYFHNSLDITDDIASLYHCICMDTISNASFVFLYFYNKFSLDRLTMPNGILFIVLMINFNSGASHLLLLRLARL